MSGPSGLAEVLGWLLCGLFLIIGLLLGGGAAYVAAQNLQAIRHHERVVGEVLELRWPAGRKPGDRIAKGEAFRVVVRFRWRGYTKHADFGSQHSGWERGERVGVYVDPERPWRVTPDDNYELWFIPGLLVCVCFTLLFFGGRIGLDLLRPVRGRDMSSGSAGEKGA